MLNVGNTVEISMAAALSYFLITLRETELQNVSASDTLNLRTVR